MPLTRSMRAMFLAIIAAMLAAVVVLHAKNEQLATQVAGAAVTP